MKILVPLRQVPDLVEDLEVDDSGTRLDFDSIKVKLNEFDDHALEEALQLKEAGGGHEVVAVAVEGEGADRQLFTALAKGADRAVMLTGADPSADNHVLGGAFAKGAASLGAELVLVGVQAPGDLDGQLAPIVAAHMNAPCVNVVTGLSIAGAVATFKKEYSGGVMGEFEADLPAVLGVQAARTPPRYAPVSKVNQIKATAKIDKVAVAGGAASAAKVTKLERPAKGQGAKMLKDAGELAALLKEKGVA